MLCHNFYGIHGPRQNLFSTKLRVPKQQRATMNAPGQAIKTFSQKFYQPPRNFPSDPIFPALFLIRQKKLSEWSPVILLQSGSNKKLMSSWYFRDRGFDYKSLVKLPWSSNASCRPIDKMGSSWIVRKLVFPQSRDNFFHSNFTFSLDSKILLHDLCGRYETCRLHPNLILEPISSVGY